MLQEVISRLCAPQQSEFQYHFRTLKIKKEMAMMEDTDMLNST